MCKNEKPLQKKHRNMWQKKKGKAVGNIYKKQSKQIGKTCKNIHRREDEAKFIAK